MLRNLAIRNYALIEHLELEFEDGLTIITGETGAGKSIMLGALSLVLGGRADTRVITDESAKAVVEAVFTNVDPSLKALAEEKGIDWIENEEGESELTIRRELSATGRSKVLINDTTVTLSTLVAMASHLIDIHSQHANAKINDASERLAIIDALAGNSRLLAEYREKFGKYVDLRRSIKRIKEENARSEARLDMLRYRLSLLEKLDPKKGELHQIEKRFEILSDADETKERLAGIAALLSDNTPGALASLSEASDLTARTRYLSNKNIGRRIAAVLQEVKDLYETVNDLYSGMDSDPGELQKMSDRMNAYYEMQKQFRVSDGDELARLRKELTAEYLAAYGKTGDLTKLEAEAKETAVILKDLASLLTASRKKAALQFAGDLSRKAKTLGLPNLCFQVAVNPHKLSGTGQDEVDFLCSFNKNGIPRPISDIASGGETSRLMLSLKAIIAGHINLPTIIFDEVDTGVSGEIADKMGMMMHSVAREMQVIVITHLPQVAARGDHHFKVYKEDNDRRTVSRVRPLTMEERIREVGGMLSGSEVTMAALDAARALLGRDTQGEKGS